MLKLEAADSIGRSARAGRHLLVVSENQPSDDMMKANYVHIIDLGVPNLEIPSVFHFKLSKDETGATVSSASMAPDGSSVALGMPAFRCRTVCEP